MRPFAYVRAETLNDATAPSIEATQPHLATAQYLAGGTTIIDLMKLDVMRPSKLIDISGLSGDLRSIYAHDEGLHLGALVRMAEAAEHPAVLKEYPVIAQSLQQAASQQIRTMATLGGNVLQRTRCNYFRDPSFAPCNKRNPGSGCAAIEGVNRKHAVLGVSERCIATYPGDFAQALIALEAQVDIYGHSGPRRIAFEDLHRAPGDTPHIETALAPSELITGFFIPAAAWTRRSTYVKVRDRQSYEFALASAAVALDLRNGSVEEARIALGGLATKPWRAREAESSLRGRAVNETSAREAAIAALASATTHGDNDYKPELGRRTLVRALLQAASMEV
jgi:xanthine dehydrogenase YagS FAD-binding subunit